MTLITSRQHAIVRQCRAIVRGTDTRLLLDGWHLVADAQAAGLPIETVAMRDDPPAAYASVVDRLASGGSTVLQVSAGVLDALSPVRGPSGVVAIAARPDVDPRALVAPAPALVMAALGVQDPGNVGALVRSADAGGATGVLLDTGSADPWGWKALRASMGSAFRLPVRRDADARARISDWRRAGLAVVATDPRDGVSLYDVDLAGPVVILVGAEGAGLDHDALAAADVRVRIPMRPRVESLNLAVAAALLVYEAARQRALKASRR